MAPRLKTNNNNKARNGDMSLLSQCWEVEAGESLEITASLAHLVSLVASERPRLKKIKWTARGEHLHGQYILRHVCAPASHPQESTELAFLCLRSIS